MPGELMIFAAALRSKVLPAYGLHVVAEKGAFGLRTECFLLPAKIQILSL